MFILVPHELQASAWAESNTTLVYLSDVSRIIACDSNRFADYVPLACLWMQRIFFECEGVSPK